MPTEPAYLSNATILYLLPEITLLAVATLIYIGGSIVRGTAVWSWVAAGGLLATAAALWGAKGGAVDVGPLYSDAFSNYVRWLVLVVGLLFVLLMSGGDDDEHAAERIGSTLMTLVGMMLVAGTRELVLLFVGLELVSIPTYLLLYLGRGDDGAREASVKYFFLSILASALMLYGFSFLYGVGGSTRMPEIAATLANPQPELVGFARLAGLGLVLVFAGLGFKIAAVPFHFYAPDVYQGTTSANAGLLSVVPKIAGIVALVRIAAMAMPGLSELGWQLALVLSAMTMTLGNVVALWQDNVRRMLAYSSIAHAGYMLIGLAVAFAGGAAVEADKIQGFGAALLYLAVYAIATAGTFAVLAYLGERQRQVDSVDDLAGLGQTHPFAGLALAIFMFSLAGIPPMAGFWGKLALFRGAIGIEAVPGEAVDLRLWFIGIAVLGVVNAAIAAAYYLRIISAVYFRQPRGVLAAEGGIGALAAGILAALLVVTIGLAPGAVTTGSDSAGRAVLKSSSPAATTAQQSPDMPALAVDQSAHP
ncbi:MAG: NADH-quinone oxidoreductase subunit N [Pirellulales bacterium]|nr:NADH-quinone oxidoreductase subunit N [Pirellulales bacterium]